MAQGQARPIKCVVVGDSTVGKTCMLLSHTTDSFPFKYVPCVLENCTADMTIDSVIASLELFDTIGRDDYLTSRLLTYHQADVFLICFSVMSPSSYENVTTKWNPEVKNYCPEAPVLLVGTKTDLRENTETVTKLESRDLPVERKQGIKLARKIKAVKYMECSALNQIGLIQMFEEVCRAVLHPQQKQKSKCLCCL